MGVGMSMGLMTAFVSNIGLNGYSQFPCGVGGAVIPMISVLTDYFATVGPGLPSLRRASTCFAFTAACQYLLCLVLHPLSPCLFVFWYCAGIH